MYLVVMFRLRYVRLELPAGGPGDLLEDVVDPAGDAAHAHPVHGPVCNTAGQYCAVFTRVARQEKTQTIFCLCFSAAVPLRDRLQMFILIFGSKRCVQYRDEYGSNRQVLVHSVEV